MNKITLSMEAKDIPEGTLVRKPQGQKTFRIRRSIAIYSATDVRIVPLEGAVYLLGDKTLNEIPKEKEMCIDFRSLVALQDWIETHFEEQV